MEHAFHKQDLVVRASGETLAFSPPLIVSEREIDEIFAKLAAAIRAVG
jgi:beta-alanine--pyruvate transaminase